MLEPLAQDIGLNEDHQHQVFELVPLEKENPPNKHDAENDETNLEEEHISAVPQCRIVDDIISSPRDSLKPSIYASNFCIFLLQCLTMFMNGLLIHFIYKYHTDPSHDSMLLLYITITAICYLPLCGLFQSLNYPQYKLGVHQLQSFLDELIAAYPKIKMFINGCNLFMKDAETGKFNKVFIRSLEQCYEYHHVVDVSDDVDQILNSLMNGDRTCYCWHIIQFNVSFHIRCGDNRTAKHYCKMRDDWIAENVKTNTKQSYISSALFINEDGQQISNEYIGDEPLKTGQHKQFWLINDKSWISYFIEDSTYWIFSVLLLSQWLYVLLTFILITKRQNFVICKEICYDPKYDMKRDE